jgi:hypothetical protein
METVYVVHPVSKEEKEKYRKKGKKIIDAKFAPEGVKVEGGKQPKAPKDQA